MPDKNYYGCRLLLCAIFKPELYQKYRELQRKAKGKINKIVDTRSGTRLVGLDSIVNYTGYNLGDVICWLDYVDFPGKKEENRWVVSKKKLKQWMKTQGIKMPADESVDFSPNCRRRKRNYFNSKRW